jgi:UDP-glucose 4-epimerase
MPGSAPGLPGNSPDGAFIPYWAGRDARVVVTGGAGYIGSRLVTRLLEVAGTVTVVDHAHPARQAPGVRYIQADLRQARAARRALRGANVVFHLAGNSDALRSVTHPRLDFEANALATFNVARAAVRAGVRRVVYLSSALTYGRQRRLPLSEDLAPAPTFPYAASKLMGENILESFRHTYRLETVVGRAFVVYGGLGANPRVEVPQYLECIYRGCPIRSLGNPDRKTRDFIHVDDVIKALLLLAEVPADIGVVNIGTGVETSLRQLADVISDTLGKPQPVFQPLPSPQDEFRQAADTTKLRELGFAASISLRAGVAQLASHARKAVDAPTRTANGAARRPAGGFADAGAPCDPRYC